MVEDVSASFLLMAKDVSASFLLMTENVSASYLLMAEDVSAPFLSMAQDVSASFLLIDDLNNLLWTKNGNRHGVPSFTLKLYPVVISWFIGPTHARTGPLDLLMTDVPDL